MEKRERENLAPASFSRASHRPGSFIYVPNRTFTQAFSLLKGIKYLRYRTKKLGMDDCVLIWRLSRLGGCIVEENIAKNIL